jgi:hypothetical protein
MPHVCVPFAVRVLQLIYEIISFLAVSLHLCETWISYFLQRLVYGMNDSPWFESRQGTSYFYSEFYWIGAGVLVQGYRSRRLKFATHLCLMLSLRMSGGVPPLPLCNFMAWRETTGLLRRDLYVYFRPLIYPILGDIAVLP